MRTLLMLFAAVATLSLAACRPGSSAPGESASVRNTCPAAPPAGACPTESNGAGNGKKAGKVEITLLGSAVSVSPLACIVTTKSNAAHSADRIRFRLDGRRDVDRFEVVFLDPGCDLGSAVTYASTESGNSGNHKKDVPIERPADGGGYVYKVRVVMEDGTVLNADPVIIVDPN